MAERFYRGKICVITGKSEAVDWHHLDEDHSNWHFANIIPIVPTFNQAIERHRKDPLLPLPPDLTLLSQRSNEHAHCGKLATAYGCARLDSFLKKTHFGEFDGALHSAAFALLNVRPLGNVDLACDTLKRSVLPIMQREDQRERVAFRTLARLVDEIGSFLRDWGMLEESEKYVSLAERLLSKESRCLQSDVTALGRMHQHKAIGLVSLGDTSARRWLDSGKDRLEDTRYVPGLGNHALWHMRLSLASSELENAEGVIQDTEKRLGRISLETDLFPGTNFGKYGWWTYGELLLARADVEWKKGQKTLSLDYAHGAQELFKNARIAPSIISGSESLRWYKTRYPDSNLAFPLSRANRQIGRFARLAREVAAYAAS